MAGEANAYEVLVKRYEKAVIAAAFAVTRLEFIAEDAAQDAFVTVWMKLDSLHEPQKFAAWVCRIAKNSKRVTAKAVSKWEKQMAYPDVILLPDIADTMGVTIDELLRKQIVFPEIKARG